MTKTSAQAPADPARAKAAAVAEGTRGVLAVLRGDTGRAFLTELSEARDKLEPGRERDVADRLIGMVQSTRTILRNHLGEAEDAADGL